MKTSELTGAALDWAVAQCENFSVRYGFDDNCPEYSTDWSQGGPIIERERISIEDVGQGYWNARIYRMHQTTGDAPLIATMRCYVASKLGDTVEIPKELQQ